MAVKKTSRTLRPLAKKIIEEKAEMPIPLASQSSMTNRLKQPKFIIGLIVVVLIGLGFYFKGLFVAALVNGEPISRLAVIQDMEKRDGKQVLSSLITQTLILQEAKKKNIIIAQKELDDMIKKLADDLKKQGQNLDEALSAQGMTRKDLEGQFRLKKLVEKLLEKDIKVTDKEISDFVEKNKASIPTDMKEEQIKANAKDQLMQEKLSVKAQAWLADLNKKATINYFVNY